MGRMGGRLWTMGTNGRAVLVRAQSPLRCAIPLRSDTDSNDFAWCEPFRRAESAESRELLRRSVGSAISHMWPDKKSSQTAQLDPSGSSGEVVFNSIEKLSPQNDVQRSLKSQAAQIATDLGQMRWLLFEQTDTSISVTMLIVLISWLAIIFMSAGLFAPPNATVIIALMLAAVSVAGAIFLIQELDMPFDGVLQISQRHMYNAL